MSNISYRRIKESYKRLFKPAKNQAMKRDRQELDIELKGIEMTIEGYYLKGEPQVMYDGNMEGYPGSDSEFEINSVKIHDQEIWDLLTDNDFDEITQICLTKIEE